MTIEELQAREEELSSRVKELFSEHESGELSGETRSEWDHTNSELDSVRSELREKLAMRARVDELSKDSEHRDEDTTPSFQTRKSDVPRGEEIYDLSTIRTAPGSSEGRRELHDRARRAIETSQFPHERADREAVQSHVEDLLVRHDDRHCTIAQRMLNTGSATYRRAFAKKVAGANLSPEESRALSLTGEFGGVAVPFTLDPTVIPTSNGVVNPLREISRVEPITTDTWKGVSSAGVEAAYSAEAAETEEAELKFAQPEVSAERASVLILASFEITQDWGSIQSEVATAIQDSKDTLEATKFLLGEGTNEPFGVQDGAEETKATAEENKFAVADLYTLKAALPNRFRPNASYIANEGIWDRIRQFDESGGANIYAENLAVDRPATLFGKPAYELSTMSSKIEGEAVHSIYGDFSYFLIAERIGVNIEVIPHVMNGKKATGQRGFYAFWRNGSKVLSKAAFIALEGK